jgi:signal transduction histidine kinase
MKPLLRSLRFRFTFTTTVWVLLSTVLAAVLIANIFRQNLIDGYHEEMQIHIEELAALTTVAADGQPYLLRRLSDPRFLPAKSGMYWQVERDGFTTLKSPSLVGANLDNGIATAVRPKSKWRQGPFGEQLEYARLLYPPNGGSPMRLLMASDRRLVDDSMASFDRSLRLSLAIFAALILAGALLQQFVGLRPLWRLRKSMNDLRSGKASQMAGDFPSELEPVVADLNALLAAKSDLVARSRLRASNLAHGLRTPLSILIDEAERLGDAGHEDTAVVIMREAMRMKRQIEYHLARARSAAVFVAPGQSSSISATLEPLLSAMKRLHRSREISFVAANIDDVDVACDPSDLAEILSILLDNAGKWARSTCTVSWLRAEDDIHIMIDDDGPGIEPNSRERAFAAGERLDDAAPGTGLGLAIARDLARLYGGDIGLEDSPGNGLRAVAALRAAKPALVSN